MMRPSNLLAYGPRPKRNLSVTRREWVGVLFILIAIPPGLYGLVLIIGGVVDPMIHDPQSERMTLGIQVTVIAVGVLCELFCSGAGVLAVRRLRPRREHNYVVRLSRQDEVTLYRRYKLSNYRAISTGETPVIR
jgi:hypothetical protein